MFRWILTSILFSVVFVQTANAQWVDPIGFGNTFKITYKYQMPNTVPFVFLPENESVFIPVRPSVPVNPYENLPAGVIVPRPAVPTNPYENLPSGVIVPNPVVPVVIAPSRPDPPVNPYENLPPGAIAPSRPAIPTNPYKNLPAGVTVPRPPICNPYRGCVDLKMVP